MIRPSVVASISVTLSIWAWHSWVSFISVFQATRGPMPVLDLDHSLRLLAIWPILAVGGLAGSAYAVKHGEHVIGSAGCVISIALGLYSLARL